MARRGDLSIRLLRPGDCDQLVALLAEAFAEEFEGSGADEGAVRRQMRAAAWTQAPAIGRLLRTLGARFAFFVADFRGRIVGSTAVGGGRLMAISSVAVLPAFRGLGIGQALVERAQGFALDQGRDRVVLDVLAHNAGAVRLYERLDYAEYHRFRAYILPALPVSITVPAPRGYWLEPATGPRTAAFSAVERASLPARYFEAAATLRDRYLRSRPARWLEAIAGGQRSYRRTLVHEARTEGYMLAAALPGQTEGRIEMPLVPPAAVDGLPAALADAIRFVEHAGRASVRLDISEGRPDQWAIVEAIGFRRRWTYIQMVRWLAAPIRLPVCGLGSRRLPYEESAESHIE